MIRRFISLEWKQFLRASYFQKGLAIKILLILAALYFGGIAILMGAGMFFILKKALPDVDPMVTVNNFLIFWILFELLIRFFMQQLPVMNVKPLMTIPIKRSKVIHYLLGKTTLSFFNFLPLFLFFPFCVVLIAQDYPVISVLCWFLSVMFISLSINYLNFLINKNNAVFYSLLGLLAALVGLQYFDIYNVIEPIGKAFNFLYSHPYLVLLPLALMLTMYYLNFKYIRSGFYLDDAVSKKIK